MSSAEDDHDSLCTALFLRAKKAASARPKVAETERGYPVRIGLFN